MLDESIAPGISLADASSVKWQVQIGPDIRNQVEGLLNAPQGAFCVVTQEPTDVSYASISTNNGGNWYQMPNNQWVYAACVGSDQTIQYAVSVPDGVEIKFLLGAS